MSKLIVLRGLPASGKSTKALEIVKKNPNAVRVNRDLMREMLFFITRDGKSEQWTEGKDQLVNRTYKNMIQFLLDNHKTVVVDDTNFNRAVVKAYEEMATSGNHTFEIVEIRTTVEECIRRDKGRKHPVGEALIRDYAAKHGGSTEQDDYGLKDGEKVTFPGEPKMIICDLDGTLCDCTHRLHYINGKRKDWAGFFREVHLDPLREGVAQLLTLTYPNHPVVLVSGRPSLYGTQTEEWLKKYGISYRKLIMRKSGDHRPDYIVKEEILLNHFNKNEIEVVIDDRRVVIDMWRRNGLIVINVGGEDNNF